MRFKYWWVKVNHALSEFLCSHLLFFNWAFLASHTCTVCSLLGIKKEDLIRVKKGAFQFATQRGI
jgi:hypothetical protein